MSEKTEKELIKTRASFKGRLTAFSNYLNGLGDSLTPVQVTELQLRTGKLDHLYQQFDEVQLRIECLVDDINVALPERNEFESVYFKVLARAQDIISQNSEKQNEGLCSERCSSRHGSQSVKLPTISLPKFSGLWKDWLAYRDTFSSLVDSNVDLSDINKFHYLRASLEGTAAIVIQSIELSAKNYSIAWGLLCERFDNKRMLIQNHVTALLEIEPLNRESSDNIKGMIDAVNKNLRALESLGEPTSHWDTLLIHILSKRLDSKTFREWEEFRGKSDQDINLDLFMKFLRNRADLLQTIEVSKSTVKHRALLSKSEPVVENSNVNMNRSNDSKSKSCPACHRDHFLQNCEQFRAMSVQERRRIIPQYKICFLCFRAGHRVPQCRGPRCRRCRGKHHGLLCTGERSATPLDVQVPADNDRVVTRAAPQVQVQSSPTL